MVRQLFEYHPTFAYRFIPSLKARVDHEGGGYLLRTNEQGFRCRHNFESEKPEDGYRVLLFGDSYTAGDGVSNKDRFGDVLETMIDGLEVYNFGLSGSGTDQQYLIYRELGASLEHDLIIIAVLVENIRRVIARMRPFVSDEGDDLMLAKPYYELEDDGSLSLHNVPTPREPIPREQLDPDQRVYVDEGGRLAWLRQTVNAMGPRIKNLTQRLTRYQPLPEFDDPTGPAWLLMKAILVQWISELRRPVVVCPIPLYQHVEETASPEAYQARFRELEGLDGVTVHDPLKDFLAHPKDVRRGFRFASDPHLTPAAHRVFAESLAPCIRSIVAQAGRQER